MHNHFFRERTHFETLGHICLYLNTAVFVFHCFYFPTNLVTILYSIDTTSMVFICHCFYFPTNLVTILYSIDTTSIVFIFHCFYFLTDLRTTLSTRIDVVEIYKRH